VLDLLGACEAAISRDGDLDEILQTLHTRANREETFQGRDPEASLEGGIGQHFDSWSDPT
jgi:hypothetical protein